MNYWLLENKICIPLGFIVPKTSLHGIEFGIGIEIFERVQRFHQEEALSGAHSGEHNVAPVFEGVFKMTYVDAIFRGPLEFMTSRCIV